ncbi:MAG: hypothetical protein KGK30_04485, partial [Elusimicrobia bacterium]|nr:hypothetical protein [Elusimicrobiota bacterium]
MIRWLEACALAALLAAAPARAAVSSGPSSWREGLQSGLDAALARRSAPAQPGVAAIFQRFAGLNLKDPMERQIAAPWLEDLSAQSDVSLARFRRMSAPDRQRFLKSRLKLVVERATRRADQAMRTSDAAELSRLAHDDLYFLDVERQHRLARARSEIGLDEARALAQELADPPWIVSIAGALPDDSPAALALSRMDLTLARTKESYALLARHLGGWSGEFHELPPERRRGLVSQALGSAQREEIQAAREFSRQAHAGLLEEERAELAQALLSRPFLDEPSARSLRAALALRAAARQAGESLPLSLYQQAFSAAQSLTQALEMAGKDRSEQAARLRDLLAAATKADSPAEAFRKTRDLRSLALRLPAAGSRAPTE